MFIASCTDLLQIVLKHFNGTQWVYEVLRCYIYFPWSFFFYDKSNEKSIF